MSKTQRLRKPAEYRLVYQSKHWGSNDNFSFNAAPADGCNRLGITVSKKVAKQAVQRNKLKRQVREFFRHHQHQLKPTDLVITARAGSAGQSPDKIRVSLEDLWARVLRWRRWYERTNK